MNIPSKNPKHSARKQQYVKKQNLSTNNINPKFILMGIVFVAVVVGVVILVISIDKLNSNGGEEETRVIEYGDSAIIEFKMWKDLNDDGVIAWDEYHLADSTEEKTPDSANTFYPTITETKDPRGFYRRIIGMTVGETDQFTLVANIDADDDGIDDITGDPVESYGKPSSPWYNTALKYHIKILNLTKKGEPLIYFTPPSKPITETPIAPSSSSFNLADMLYCANSLIVKKWV